MATLNKSINKNFLDNILPVYGNARINEPIWDEGQKMFIIDEHESFSGNRSYRGVRFSDRVGLVDQIGKFYNWTYINSIELYAFNGANLELIQERSYKRKFRDDKMIRLESEDMVRGYLAGMYKAKNELTPEGGHEMLAKVLVDACYKSFLDEDFNMRLVEILPMLKRK